MWKATVIECYLSAGTLRVSVEFSSGEERFVDHFDTNQKQPKTWLVEQVRRRLEHLNELPSLFAGIHKGDVITLPDKPEVPADWSEKKAEYKRRYDHFQKWVAAFTVSVTDESDQAFIAEHKWLKDNFDPDYLEFF